MVDRVQRAFSGFLEHALGEERVCEPAVDIFETKTHLQIEIQLPGVRKEEIELYIIRDRLYVQAQRFEELDPEKEGLRRAYLCLERECGRYYREIDLTIPCKASQGKARLENGILTIEFPKVEDRRGQRRDVKIE